MTRNPTPMGRWPAAAVIVVAVAALASLVYVRNAPRASLPATAHHGIVPGDSKRLAEVRAEFDRGVVLLRQGQFDAAASAFHRVLVLAPTLPEGHLNMAFTLYEMGNLSGARKFFESARALDRRMSGADYGIALVTFAEGDRDRAVVLMRRYLEDLPQTDPNRAKALRRLAEMEASMTGKEGRR